MSHSSRRLLVLGLAFLLLPLVGCGGGGPGGANSSDDSVATSLIVQRVLPTNGQEVLNDLSDVGGVLEVKFSEKVAAATVLDPNNAFNGLSSDLNILDSAFARVPGTPSIVGDRGNILHFVPSGGTLPNGQYTVTCSRDVRNFQGGRLNQGLFDTRSSFTVGVDIYSPVIRNTFPAPNQVDVAKDSQIIVTFNESLDPQTVTPTSFTVADGGTNPPTPILGTVSLARDNFEIVWTPDPNTLMPPNTTVIVTVTGGAAGINDQVSNPFEGDPLTPPTYQFQFKTVVEPPAPANPPPVDTLNLSATVYYATSDSVGTISEDFFGLGVAASQRDMNNWLIDLGSTAPADNINPVDFSETKIGRPEEIVLDPRLSPADLHTWMYVVDRAGRDIVIVNTRDTKIVGRWKNFSDPRGLAIRPGGQSLYVTDYTNSSVQFLNTGLVSPWTSVFTAQAKSIGDPVNQQTVLVGRGPTGAAHQPDSTLLFIANALDNSCSVINAAAGTLNTTFSVGSFPQQVEATAFINPVGWFAFITCLGGEGDPDGSVALWWSSPNGLQANITGFKNPRGAIYDLGISTWIGNSGGNTVSRLTLAFAGGGFAATILPTIDATATVGNNPNSVTIDPLMPAIRQPLVVISADRGSGQVSLVDSAEPWKLPVSIMIPGVHEVASYWDQ